MNKKLKIKDLKKLDKNPRTIKDESFKKLCSSIKNNSEYFEARPVIVSTRTGENIILAGNQRYEAAKKIGLKEIPVYILEGLTEHKEREIIIRDNVSNGDWDMDILASDWSADDLLDWDLDLPELQEVEELDAEEVEADDANEIETDIVLGDLIEIGEHRVLCGDSSMLENVSMLMNDSKADLLLTDPPYGVSMDKGFSGSGGFGGKGKKIKRAQYSDDWDSIRPDAGTFFIALENCKDAIIFGGNFFADILPQSSHWIVWDKKNTMPTFGDCELAWTNIDRKSVKKYEFEYNGLIGREKERFHPTQKPVGLISDIMKDYSEEGQLILDLFIGSGTSMIAAHQLNRICYGLELDPKYCQVIINRMRTLDPKIRIKINGKRYE